MKPTVFIGSSVEGKAIADALQVALDYEAHCEVWHQAFPIASTTIDSLLAKLSEKDFAIFVLSADDSATSRGSDILLPRDNVIFEAGIFMGLRGKERCFLVIPRDIPDLHVPTDVLGITVANYESARATRDINGAVGSAATKIRQEIQRQSVIKNIDIVARATDDPSATYPLKLWTRVTNPSTRPVAIESIDFTFNPSVRLAPNMHGLSGGKYRPLFSVGQRKRAGAIQDVHEPRYVIAPEGHVEFWVPIDPAIGRSELERCIKAGSVGTWRFRTVYFDGAVIQETVV